MERQREGAKHIPSMISYTPSIIPSQTHVSSDASVAQLPPLKHVLRQDNKQGLFPTG